MIPYIMCKKTILGNCRMLESNVKILSFDKGLYVYNYDIFFGFYR